MRTFEKRLSYSMAIGLILAAQGAVWDTQIWHQTAGRESLWQAPHLLIYIGVLFGMCASLLGWWKVRTVFWKNCSIAILLVPFFVFVDDLWHRIFGLEEIGILLRWSPPHVALIFTYFLIAARIFQLQKKLESPRRGFPGVLEAALLASTVQVPQFALYPFFPLTEFSVLGFWGAGIEFGAALLLFLLARTWFVRPHSALRVALLYCILQCTTYGMAFLYAKLISYPYEDITRMFWGGFFLPPIWLLMISVVGVALLVDRAEWGSRYLRAGIAALFFSLLYYGVSPSFVEESTVIVTSAGMLQAVVASLLAGGAVVWVVHLATERQRYPVVERGIRLVTGPFTLAIGIGIFMSLSVLFYRALLRIVFS